MSIPQVLALTLEEAVRRLEEAGVSYEVKALLPPRSEEADFEGIEVRKYVVRQQLLSANKVGLSVVYRLKKEVHGNGSEN